MFIDRLKTYMNCERNHQSQNIHVQHFSLLSSCAKCFDWKILCGSCEFDNVFTGCDDSVDSSMFLYTPNFFFIRANEFVQKTHLFNLCMCLIEAIECKHAINTVGVRFICKHRTNNHFLLSIFSHVKHVKMGQ